mmetsp:Transcript_18912/g.55012  ORF Transcript_18912/g.55012 Transcript_18912/m.55012 type:complete len:107 (+) Transcript_18912:444-764(+)
MPWTFQPIPRALCRPLPVLDNRYLRRHRHHDSLPEAGLQGWELPASVLIPLMEDHKPGLRPWQGSTVGHGQVERTNFRLLQAGSQAAAVAAATCAVDGALLMLALQ